VAASLQLDPGPTAALREGRAPVRDRLTAMLFLMALLHAIVILGLTFSGSTGIQTGNAPQLDVLLVTNEVPEAKSNNQARYLAQRTQIGAGNTSAPQPVTSPGSRGAAASEQRANTGSGAGNDSEQRALRVLSAAAASRDIRYLGEAPAAAAASPPQFVGSTEGEPRSGRGDAAELLLTGKANPGHWVTPDTRASELAPYLAAWKRKVERVGTLNFPSAARRSGLTGSPVLEVDIDASGHLRQARVRRSSGFGALDEAALAILKLASPFDPLPSSLANDYSQLRLAYQWDFVAGTLQTSAVTSSADTPSRP
jgi:protein TonB